MTDRIERRQFLALTGLGGVVFASGLGLPARAAGEDFFFVQLSDTHWGFSGPQVNPEAATTLRRAIAAVNALSPHPDFVVFTGDLTHTTDFVEERRKRMGEFRAIAAELRAPSVRYMPGEHDASLDAGAAFREYFGDMHWSFDHKGIHFVAIDNVSDPKGRVGDEQLAWLAGDLAAVPAERPVIAFTHRPLFDLYPEWDWFTADGVAVLDRLMTRRNVTVFYGHIHQEHHFTTGHIAHHAATSLMFPLPAPGSQPKRTPLPWDADRPFRGLGWRGVTGAADRPTIVEKPVA